MKLRSTASVLRYLTCVVAVVGTISRLVISMTRGNAAFIFGYFTVQSNIMVCLFLLTEITRRSKTARHIDRHIDRHIEMQTDGHQDGSARYDSPVGAGKLPPSVHGAVLLYILITGLVYNLLLAGNTQSQGFDLLVLNINHGVTPLLFLLDWLTNRKPGKYPWKYLGFWLIYPLLYAVYGSIEGLLTGSFRYFFLDFANRNPPVYAAQLAMVISFFVLLGALIVILSRRSVLSDKWQKAVEREDKQELNGHV